MLNKIRKSVNESFVKMTYNKIMKLFKNSVFGGLLMSVGGLTLVWYDSLAYKGLSMPARKLKSMGVYGKVDVTPVVLGVFLGFAACMPQGMWNDVYILIGFLALSVFFIISSDDVRAVSNYSMVFMGFLAVSVAIFAALGGQSGAMIVVFLLTSVCFSALIIFSINAKKDIIKILCGVYFAICVLSVYMFLEIIWGKIPVAGNMKNATESAQVMVMLFPLAFCYAVMQRRVTRKIIYSVCLFPALLGIVLGYSKSGYIGFASAFLLFAVLINWRFGGVIAVVSLVSAPALTEYAMYHIKEMWEYQSSLYNINGNIIGLVNLAQGVYSRGVGVGSAPFLNIYSNYALSGSGNVYYLRTILEFGSVVLLIVLWYLIKIIRKGVVRLFRSPHDIKMMLSAVLSSLVGITVMSVFGINWLNPRMLIIYWFVMGVVVALNRIEV